MGIEHHALHAALRTVPGLQSNAHFIALTVALAADDADPWVQILPAGKFRARDGRPEKVPHWSLDASIAIELIARYAAQATDMVIDYEHQTLNAEANGQPAPAAGWIHELQWREGAGLFGRVEWTDRARAAIRAGEYRYFSPVFTSDEKTGAVTALLMGAITNFPGLDGMTPIRARHTAEDTTMNPLLAALIAALALGANTTEDQAVTAVNALKGLDLPKLRKQLGLKDDADGAAIVAGIDALAVKLEARDTEIVALKATPVDLAKYAPMSVVDALKSDLATLREQHGTQDAEQLITEGLADGRLHKSQEGWARDLAKSNVTALRGYLASAKPIDALRGTQTQGRQPEQETGEHGLTVSELSVCRATGVDPADFAKAKKSVA